LDGLTDLLQFENRRMDRKESNALSSRGSEARRYRNDLQYGQHWARLILDAGDDGTFGAL
jgi:hypothetical protein